MGPGFEVLNNEANAGTNLWTTIADVNQRPQVHLLLPFYANAQLCVNFNKMLTSYEVHLKSGRRSGLQCVCNVPQVVYYYFQIGLAMYAFYLDAFHSMYLGNGTGIRSLKQ